MNEDQKYEFANAAPHDADAPSGFDDPDMALLKAKTALIDACDDISPMELVRDHPLLSVSSAFALGIGAGSLLAGKSSDKLLAQAAQISAIASPFLSLFYRMRQ